MNENLERNEVGKFPEAAVAQAEAQILELSKRIEFYLTEYTLELLVGKLQSEDFFIPPYQREFTWEPERKSRFIESLLMGLPIPFLFFYEQPETGKLEVVDGSQRLRTIAEFLRGELELGELDQLDHLERFRFTDLPESRQRKFKNKSIRAIVLNEHADEAARFDLFERINTGSKIAKEAEVRRGALGGPFMALVVELAKDPLFVQLTPLSTKAERERQREELVTRFFAYGDGLDDYHDRVSDFLFAYVQKMNASMHADSTVAAELRQRFTSTMEFIKRVFPNGFKKTVQGTTTHRARFEAIAVGSFMAIQSKPAVLKGKIDVSEWVDSKKFLEVTGSDGANAIGRLKSRIGFVSSRLVL